MKNEEPMNESQENDLLTFASEKEDLKNEMSGHWKILIVDDDMDVHRVTKLVLSGFEFGGKIKNAGFKFNRMLGVDIYYKNL